MRIGQVVHLLNRFAAAHRGWVAGAALAVGVLGVALLKAHGRLGPGRAVARDVAEGRTGGMVGAGGTDSADFQRWVRGPVGPVSRNLFYINLEQFPRASAAPAGSGADARGPAAGAVAGGGETGGLRSEIPDARAKSPGDRSEDGEEPENDFPKSAADRMSGEARRLHLQSVVMGPTPRAMVDGQLLSEGDVVANFRVLRIEARGITLEREGIKLELLFKHDLSR